MSMPPRNETIPAGRCDCGHWARPDEITRCRLCDCQHHVAKTAGSPQTPPGAERDLQSYSDALEEAGEKLAAARNAELEAEEARDTAKRRALLSPDCPQAGVFDGVRVTVAYVAAWVEDQIAGAQHAYRLARVARQAASDHLRKVGKQGSFQQTLTKSVGTAYQNTGSEPWERR
jgi:hypothetical protein